MLTWNLSRPKPALPSSYFWTWDHSTNWMLDDPGLLNFGCANKYLKRPETYIEDYRRLTDFAAGLGVKGVLIWGFLRDSHGGVESARAVADYAARRGVAITPGIGTTHYGGVYYEGEHPYNLETFLAAHPEAQMMAEDGTRMPRSACATYPGFVDWLQESCRWLFDEFNIGGANIENGDFLVCHDPGCKAFAEDWPADDPDFFRFQAMSYLPAVEALRDRLADNLVTWATYTGFVPAREATAKYSPAQMSCLRPAMIDRIAPESIGQWTLSGMVRPAPLPLTDYLDDGAPEAVFDNPGWPRDLQAPAARNVGFLHHASQWSHVPRYDQAVSSIKEACLRAWQCGLEGVSIHGEVSPIHIPWALNYLAFSHFIHWPDDSLRAFGRKTLGPVLGSDDEGEAFAEVFAHFDAGTVTDAPRQDVQARVRDLRGNVARGTDLDRWRFWDWLSRMIENVRERHTASFF